MEAVEVHHDSPNYDSQTKRLHDSSKLVM